VQQTTPISGAPVITHISPTAALNIADAATNVLIGTPVQVTFSAAMDPTTLTADNIALTDASGNAVAGTMAVSTDNNAANDVATFTPSSPLASFSKYTVTLSSNIKDASGNDSTASSITFTTGCHALSWPSSGSTISCTDTVSCEDLYCGGSTCGNQSLSQDQKGLPPTTDSWDYNHILSIFQTEAIVECFSQFTTLTEAPLGCMTGAAIAADANASDLCGLFSQDSGGSSGPSVTISISCVGFDLSSNPENEFLSQTNDQDVPNCNEQDDFFTTLQYDIDASLFSVHSWDGGFNIYDYTIQNKPAGQAQSECQAQSGGWIYNAASGDTPQQCVIYLTGTGTFSPLNVGEALPRSPRWTTSGHEYEIDTDNDIPLVNGSTDCGHGVHYCTGGIDKFYFIAE
jgi:hypothetical protein